MAAASARFLMASVSWLKVLALTLTALSLVPVGAHLFELPNKIGTDRDAYFLIQRIYTGWAWFGAVLIGAVLANLVLCAALRRERAPAILAALAAALIACSLVVFFIWTEPANRATANWTMMPADWQQLRLAWEASHAVNAALIFAAFVACATAVALASPPGQHRPA